MKLPLRFPHLHDTIELRLLVGNRAYGDWFPARIIFISNNTILTCKTPDGAILIRSIDEYDFLWRYIEVVPPATT